MTFERWMHEIDLLCFAWYGQSVRDLPDMRFSDAYDDGLQPEQFMEQELGTLEDLAHLILS